MLDPLISGWLRHVFQLYSQLNKAFNTLRSVEESLDISLESHKHSLRAEGALYINVRYVDGVNLTYGSPRYHIWTFANALDEAGAGNNASRCSCTDSSRPSTPPPFIGNDYFCETGMPPGQQFNIQQPPWFCKQLPQSTNADLDRKSDCAHIIRQVLKILQ